MRVLHVIPSLSAAHGGPTRALVMMERQLSALGVTVHTITGDDDGPGRRNGKYLGEPLTENGATHRYFRRQTQFYSVSLPLARWLRRYVADYDLLHIHALFSFSSMAAVHAARRAGVPYILRPLGTLASYGVQQRRPWLKRLSLTCLEGPALRHAAAVHFTSAEEQREAGALGLPMRGVVIPLGIEDAVPAVDVLVRAQFPALAGSRYLLSLSRLDPKKNIEGLLRAFAQCSPQWSGVKLLVAGSGASAYVEALKALANKLGLSDHVVWAGQVDGDLKARAFAGAELFVLPSFSENFGIAAAEALMAGVPCVLAQGVAIAQDVTAAGAGLAVTPDPASIAVALLQLMADSNIRAQMSVQAKALAQEKYSAPAMGTRLLELYTDILSR